MNKNGFIFIYVLLLSFIILSIGTYVFNKGIILTPFVRASSNEQKLRALVLGVVQQCVVQLAIPKQDDTQQKKEEPQKINTTAIDFELFFPLINRWQEYELREKIEGIDANVSICFICEEGKFNLNNFFDFKEKSLKKESPIDELSKMLEMFQIKGFKDQLEQFFKKRSKPLDDVTELLQDDYFQKHFGKRIFYIPSKESDEKKEIYLLDLFTLYNPNVQLNPFFLSDSVTQLFEFRRAATQPLEERKKHIESVKKELKESFSFADDWKKFIQPMYQKPIGRFVPFFKKTISCNFFSAVCRVKIGQRSETVFVIFSRKERVQDDKIMYDVDIMRLYFV